MSENKPTKTAEQIRQEVLASRPAPRAPKLKSSVTASIVVAFLNSDLVADYNVESKFPKKHTVQQITSSMKALIRRDSLPVVAFEHDEYGACLARVTDEDN